MPGLDDDRTSARRTATIDLHQVAIGIRQYLPPHFYCIAPRWYLGQPRLRDWLAIYGELLVTIRHAITGLTNDTFDVIGLILVWRKEDHDIPSLRLA